MHRFQITIQKGNHQVHQRIYSLTGVMQLHDIVDERFLTHRCRVVLYSRGNQFLLNGHVLHIGQHRTFALKETNIIIQRLADQKQPIHHWDKKLLLTCLLVFVFVHWNDAANSMLQESPSAERIVSGFWGSWSDSRLASLQPHIRPTQHIDTSSLQVGPSHLNDDHLTGIGYADWYQSKRGNHERLEEAINRMLVNDSDPMAHWLLGQAAYHVDEYEIADDHFARAVVDFDSSLAFMKRGLAQMRRGHHKLEIGSYYQALAKQPENHHAQGLLVVALARIGNFHDSAFYLEQLQKKYKNDPFVDWISAKSFLFQGESEKALENLENAMKHRQALAAEQRVDMYRDIAIDPIFASLRRDPRLHSMLLRYFGADAPKRSR